MTFKSFRKWFVKIKFYLTRSISYMSIANSCMILFLFLAKFEDYGINIKLQEWGIIIYITGFMLMILLGFLEVKLGFLTEEQDNMQQKSLVLMDILNKVNKIEKDLKELKNTTFNK